MLRNAELLERFPVGSKVRDSRYGDVEFEVVDYWRGDLRLKEPTLGTTHCCPVSGATLIAAPRTVLVHLNVTLPARPAPGETKAMADDLGLEIAGSPSAATTRRTAPRSPRRSTFLSRSRRRAPPSPPSAPTRTPTGSSETRMRLATFHEHGNALAVLICDPKIRAFLEETDPQALEQARKALGLPEA